MVSSFGLHHRNERTLRELMRIHPDEHPVSIQLFGHDAEAMRSGAAIAAEAGADLIDINMGCPVRKVRRTGAGVELLHRPRAGAGTGRAASEGSGRPVTVKLRSGLRPEDRSGFELAVRLAEEGGAAAIAFHPRAATAGHKGEPDYALTRELAERLEVPVIVSGGLKTAEAARSAYRESGADAVMIARGALGNPWVFEELTGRRAEPPRREEVVAELLWTIDRAEEHLGTERATRYLRKFYPWYVDSLAARGEAREELQQSADLDRARALVAAGAGRTRSPQDPENFRRIRFEFLIQTCRLDSGASFSWHKVCRALSNPRSRRARRMLCLSALCAVAAPLAWAAALGAGHHRKLRSTPGGEQMFVVPTGVHKVKVEAIGGTGGAATPALGGEAGDWSAPSASPRAKPCT